ncbi:hypothetical protein GKE82_26215 [Conexibacter sp. W3-3-2]|uniref:RNA polymerase sigma factor n=1 Tax=Conexibacter sp. W3-3-2 TaxID=2675227 RepID=UPI0012B7CB01|nr:sigma-70 family RNA polymerase sigma factor [Conexibacter sp. W3-3-2]MTD47616.1 hypothetical protein [Conexibacter sp. W3-3-2]MTD47701.1 hypothetical protein [Conexibacter sp. W3-3-2]
MKPVTRNEQFTAAYKAIADRLHRQVRGQMPWASEALIEEALADTWLLALTREHVDLTCHPRLYGWLSITARRRVLDAHARSDRDAPIGDVIIDNGEPSAHEKAVAREELAAMAASLTERQRTVLGLLATGHSYREIQEITGDSARAVERLSVEGRARARASRPR